MPRQHWHINYIDLSFAFNIFIKETLCKLIIVKKTPVSAFLVLHCFQYPQITDTSYSWIIPLLMVQLRVNCPIPQNISRTIYCYCYQSLTQNAGHIKLNIATCVRGWGKIGDIKFFFERPFFLPADQRGNQDIFIINSLTRIVNHVIAQNNKFSMDR